MKKFCADASLMRISRQIERGEMCYRNDEGVIPFLTQVTNEEEHPTPGIFSKGEDVYPQYFLFLTRVTKLLMLTS